MRLPLVPLLLTCGPAVLSTFAFLRALKEYRIGRIRTFPLWALGGAWLVTAYAAYIFLCYSLKPSPFLPPWKDPETLGLAMLFFLAPIGIVAAALAGRRGASRWVVVPLVAALLILFYGGLVRQKNVLNALSMAFICLGKLIIRIIDLLNIVCRCGYGGVGIRWLFVCIWLAR